MSSNLSQHLLCPICSSALADHNDVFICPNSHGRLVSGKYLSNIENEPAINELTASSVDNHQGIVCPHCHAQMQKVDYNGTKIIIDACFACHYRWLDAGEVTKIQNYKADFSAKDLLFIANFNEQINAVNKKEIKDPNPRLPLQGWYRSSGAVSIVGSKSIYYITGQGIFGLIKGLLHSKTSRIITISTVLILGLLFYVIFTDARGSFNF